MLEQSQLSKRPGPQGRPVGCAATKNQRVPRTDAYESNPVPRDNAWTRGLQCVVQKVKMEVHSARLSLWRSVCMAIIRIEIDWRFHQHRPNDLVRTGSESTRRQYAGDCSNGKVKQTT